MKIFLIAGEPSGDAIGAKLVKALRAQSSEPIEICGVGGPLMEEAGCEVKLPMDQLSVMGILEIIPKLPRLYKIHKALLSEIEDGAFDAVVTIDLPDFNFILAKALKKRHKTKAKIIHYVAPTVWAWRPGRAKKIAKFLDGIICLFPFEPQFFKKHKLNAICSGHPLIEDDMDSGDGPLFRERNKIPEDAKTLGLFFGSRKHELKNMGDILKEAALFIQEKYPDLHVIIPTLPSMEYEVIKALEGFELSQYVVTEKERKWNSIAACDVAVAVSGTIGLELAYMGIPHVIAYKMNPLNWLIVKRMAKVEHAHLANIMLKKKVVPEYLQGKSTPENISKGALRLLADPKAIAFQKKGFRKVRELLGEDTGESPSAKAAQFILGSIKGSVAGDVPQS